MAVKRQKGVSQDGGNKKTKLAKFSEKQTLRTLLTNITYEHKKCSFFGKFDKLCFFYLRLEIRHFEIRRIFYCFSFLQCFPGVILETFMTNFKTMENNMTSARNRSKMCPIFLVYAYCHKKRKKLYICKFSLE